jgi:hypothetical protein
MDPDFMRQDRIWGIPTTLNLNIILASINKYV